MADAILLACPGRDGRERGKINCFRPFSGLVLILVNATLRTRGLVCRSSTWLTLIRGLRSFTWEA